MVPERAFGAIGTTISMSLITILYALAFANRETDLRVAPTVFLANASLRHPQGPSGLCRCVASKNSPSQPAVADVGRSFLFSNKLDWEPSKARVVACDLALSVGKDAQCTEIPTFQPTTDKPQVPFQELETVIPSFVKADHVLTLDTKEKMEIARIALIRSATKTIHWFMSFLGSGFADRALLEVEKQLQSKPELKVYISNSDLLLRKYTRNTLTRLGETYRGRFFSQITGKANIGEELVPRCKTSHWGLNTTATLGAKDCASENADETGGPTNHIKLLVVDGAATLLGSSQMGIGELPVLPYLVDLDNIVMSRYWGSHAILHFNRVCSRWSKWSASTCAVSPQNPECETPVESTGDVEPANVLQLLELMNEASTSKYTLTDLDDLASETEFEKLPYSKTVPFVKDTLVRFTFCAADFNRGACAAEWANMVQKAREKVMVQQWKYWLPDATERQAVQRAVCSNKVKFDVMTVMQDGFGSALALQMGGFNMNCWDFFDSFTCPDAKEKVSFFKYNPTSRLHFNPEEYLKDIGDIWHFEEHVRNQVSNIPTQELLHRKWTVTDGKYVQNGSFNLSGMFTWMADEIVMMLESVGMARFMNALFDHDKHCAHHYANKAQCDVPDGGGKGIPECGSFDLSPKPKHQPQSPS